MESKTTLICFFSSSCKLDKLEVCVCVCMCAHTVYLCVYYVYYVYSPQIYDEFLLHKKYIFNIKDACHGRNDAICVISVTNSNSLAHKMRIVKRFDFHHTKAIAHRQSTIFDEFTVTLKIILKSKMHAMEETMLSV